MVVEALEVVVAVVGSDEVALPEVAAEVSVAAAVVLADGEVVVEDLASAVVVAVASAEEEVVGSAAEAAAPLEDVVVSAEVDEDTRRVHLHGLLPSIFCLRGSVSTRQLAFLVSVVSFTVHVV